MIDPMMINGKILKNDSQALPKNIKLYFYCSSEI